MLAFSSSESKQGDAAGQDCGYCRDGSSRSRGRRLRNRACRVTVASEGDLFGLPSVVGDEVVSGLLEASNVAAKQRCFGRAYLGRT